MKFPFESKKSLKLKWFFSSSTISSFLGVALAIGICCKSDPLAVTNFWLVSFKLLISLLRFAILLRVALFEVINLPISSAIIAEFSSPIFEEILSGRNSGLLLYKYLYIVVLLSSLCETFL